MLLKTEGPTAASMTALGPTRTLGAAEEAREPLQSAIQEP